MQKLFRNADLLSTLTDEDIDFIASRSEEVFFQKNQVIFNKGAAAIHFYIIIEGEVGISQIDEENGAIDLARYVDGNSFGEFDFVTSTLYRVEARALQDSSIIIFPAFPHTLESLTQEQPETITRIYLRSLMLLSSRIRSAHTLISENTSWIKQLQNQLYTDHLTGLYTKMYLETEIPRLLIHPVIILMVKPDRFKLLNDIYGHKAGDAVLVRLCRLLSDTLKHNKKGWAIRLRSNESALVLQDTTKDEALAIAKEISAEISQIGPSQLFDTKSKHKKNISNFYLTASMAIGSIDTKSDNWKQIYDLTYDLLHKAWQKGGNRILVLKK